MTVWIIPESDREGGAVCQFWLQGGKHNETPTDKNLVWCDPRAPPPPLGRKEGTLSSPKNSLKKKNQQRESNLARRKRSQQYSPPPPVAPPCVGCQPGGIDL